MQKLSEDYQRVEAAIRYLEQNEHRQPSLKEVAGGVGLSEFYFQRLFSRWVGISPKRFLQYLTKESAKKRLEGSSSILEAALDSGLSGPGRLHDLFVSCEAVTPGEYRQRGRGLRISFGFHPTPFGECMLAVTARGICALQFVRGDDRRRILEQLARQWKFADLVSAQKTTLPLALSIFNRDTARISSPLYLHVRGTNFQLKVWEALLKIPPGRVVSYEDVARHIGRPTAARAVGNAVGSNPIPILIPCHRVIRKFGDFGNYGEGPRRKKAILAWEAARADAARPDRRSRTAPEPAD